MRRHFGKFSLFIDRRLLSRFDWGLFFLTIVIIGIGILNLYSAGYSVDCSGVIYKKQLCWVFVGVVGLFFGAFLNYSYFERYCYFFYFLSLFLLVLVLFQGRLVSGSARWLQLGQFNLQPSELVKVTLVMVLARWFQRKHYFGGLGLSSLVLPFVFVAVPFFLILLQPDLGTSLVLLLVLFSVFFFLKIKPSALFVLFGCGLCLLPLFWSLLKAYQKKRVLGFLSPELDPFGRSYQIIQSKIAIGSGKMFGKGFLKGTQAQLSFVPEKDTDFLFAVLCEEWGFVGAGFLIVLYFLLIVRLLYIVSEAKDDFGMILGFGLTALLFWQFIINLGMVLGLLPTVGIALPLFSYGGSSLITTMFLLGIIINIHIQKHIF